MQNSGGFTLIILFYYKSTFGFLRIILSRWLQDLFSLLRVSHGGKFVHIRVAEVVGFFLRFRNWPDTFLLIRLFSVYEMDSDLKKKKKKRWMNRMRLWVPFSLYIFPADCVLEASDCFGWKSSSRSWQVPTSFNGGGCSILPILVSLREQSLIPDFSLLLSSFYCNREREF